MRLSAFLTTATVLAIASLCDAGCDGQLLNARGQCTDGEKLFCHLDSPTCLQQGQTVSFDKGSRKENEKVCKDQSLYSSCIIQYCCA
ncbi:unnamed protein product [Diplocarpon coronariae]